MQKKVCARIHNVQFNRHTHQKNPLKVKEKVNRKKLAVVSLCGFVYLVNLIVNSSMKRFRWFTRKSFSKWNKNKTHQWTIIVFTSASSKKTKLSVLNQNIKCLMDVSIWSHLRWLVYWCWYIIYQTDAIHFYIVCWQLFTHTHTHISKHLMKMFSH